ncbi:hypothetical protein C0992_009828 [Termitomyces sp. T32_za158]|nr:hypothetical protein C0992_009828 [Termitomyces sp. T32_za158]
MSTPSNHGGARPGAGRKPKNATMKPRVHTGLKVKGTSGIPPAQRDHKAENEFNPTVLSAEGYSDLQSAWEEIQSVEVTEGHGDAEVEESLFDNSESLAESMTHAEAEAEAESHLQGVHIEYLLGLRDRIKAEIKQFGQPLCYKTGTFWIYPRDTLFALHTSEISALGYSPTELYHLPVFVWLPAVLPGCPDIFRCTKCGHHLVRKGFNANPVARRVRNLHNDYFLLTARFLCNKDAANDPGCGASYQGTDPEILAQLTRHVQEEFPAYITARGAIDKKLMSVMCTLFAGRFGPEPFASLLGEMRRLHHSRRELSYLAACASSKYPSQHKPEPFSSFDDKQRYAGTHPSTQYCKSVFVDWSRAHRVFLDRMMASLPGEILKGDHTFKLMKNMAKLSGEPTHDAMYTILNEWEEAQNQALTLTKALSYVSEMYEDIAEGLKEHGHPPTSFMWTDNASGEQAFHESTTRSLTENVVHNELDPNTHLPMLTIPPEMQIVTYENFDLIDSACGHILDSLPSDGSHLVIGFDIEYEVETNGVGGPGTVPRARMGQLDVIQLATADTIYVFKVSQIYSHSSVPPLLLSILISEQIIKTGRAVRADLQRVAEAWSLSELTALLDHSKACTIELGALAKLKGKISDASAGLNTLVAAVLRKRITKSDAIRLSRWSSSLSQAQIDYAVLDAYASWKVWETLYRLPSVGLHIEDDSPGQLVSWYSGKKVVAVGSIIPMPAKPEVTVPSPDPASSETKIIRITPSRILIRVETVMVPGFIPTLYHTSLENLSAALHPLDLVVAKSALRTRSETPPVKEPVIIPAAPVQIIGQFQIEDPANMDSDLDNSDSDSDSDSESDLFDVPQQFLSESTMQIPTINTSNSDDEYAADDIDDLIRNVDLNTLPTTTPNPLHQPEVSSDPLPSRIFDDLWHVQDRLLRLLPKGHSAFKAFASQFSQVLLVPDKSDIAAVMAVFEKRGFTWSYALRSHSDAIRRRVRRYCPGPEKLAADLRVLFDGWANVSCSVNHTHGPLFSEEAKKQAARIIQVAELGLLSDPPGFSLYRRIGTDPDGLAVYRCLRGTNSIEGGIHMALRRTFGSLRASPELADAILANIRHRRNLAVGYFNRTGKRYRTHYDSWRTDEIVELALALDISPSFPMPTVLGTRIATKECSGIIKVPKALTTAYGMHRVEKPIDEGTPRYRDVPVHLLTHLSTAPKSIYSYLSERQQTVHAVVPIHTSAEYQLYNELLATNAFNIQSSRGPTAARTAKSINFEKLAFRWNQVVHERPDDKIYYKIPQQLERHHKIWAAYRAEKATLLNSAQARKNITDLLNDPARQSRVLPALTLPKHPVKPDETLSPPHSQSKGKEPERPKSPPNTDIMFNADALRTIGLDPATLYLIFLPRPAPRLDASTTFIAKATKHGLIKRAVAHWKRKANATPTMTIITNDPSVIDEELEDLKDALSPFRDQL